jgi:hypothetical protein
VSVSRFQALLLSLFRLLLRMLILLLLLLLHASLNSPRHLPIPSTGSRTHPSKLRMHITNEIAQPLRRDVVTRAETEHLETGVHVAEDLGEVPCPRGCKVFVADAEEEDDAGVECGAPGYY